jgi:hypothetical protein
MSHFTVLVISKPGEDPEKFLEPFQENNMGDCPPEYMEFNDRTEELKKEYEEEDAETKEKYPTFEKYAEEYNGYKVDENGRYGYWGNPNAKWDWYQLGGRWTGYFKAKEGAMIVTGSPGLLTPSPESGWGDQFAKKDIDFAFMRKEAEDKAGEFYDKVMKIIGDLPPIQTWEHVRETLFPDNIEKAREYYHDQPRKKALADFDKANGTHDFIFMDLEEFNDVSKEAYMKNAGDASFVPFAVLKDGKWYEKGQMGWWASVSNEKDKGEWNAEVAKMIEELEDDMVLSVYDCHI